MKRLLLNVPITFIYSVGSSALESVRTFADGLGTSATAPTQGAVSMGQGLKGAIGASILSKGPGVDSAIERQLVTHYFFGGGRDFVMTPDQTLRYLQNPKSSEFESGIGRESRDSSGRIDRYDFDPQPRGQRSIPGEIKTRIANDFGRMFNGVPFDIFLNPGGACP